MATSHWLLKSEPNTYSFSDLEKDKSTHWDGVRNYQARNHLRNARKGDLALIYHSGDERAVVGIAEVTREAYPDPDPKKAGDWVQIDLKPITKLKEPVSLKQIKSAPVLKDLPLLKQSRLSVMPITSRHYKAILKIGGVELK